MQTQESLLSFLPCSAGSGSGTRSHTTFAILPGGEFVPKEGIHLGYIAFRKFLAVFNSHLSRFIVLFVVVICYSINCRIVSLTVVSLSLLPEAELPEAIAGRYYDHKYSSSG